MKQIVSIGLTLAIIGCSVASLEAAADDSTLKTALFARVHNGYQRTKLPDGSYKIETYALANRGADNAAMVDGTIDTMPFLRIAEILAQSLAERRYAPSSDPENTDLLIIVSYGRTAGTERAADSPIHHQFYAEMQSVVAATDGLQKSGRHPLESLMTQIGMENAQRERENQRNARVLGFQEELARTDTIAQYSAGGVYRGDLIADVEEDRYFVILVACDFRLATKEKKIRPLWSARFNTAARGKSFQKALPSMTTFAARYFGHDSGGLLRDVVPVGKVGLKEMVEVDDDEPAK